MDYKKIRLENQLERSDGYIHDFVSALFHIGDNIGKLSDSIDAFSYSDHPVPRSINDIAESIGNSTIGGDIQLDFDGNFSFDKLIECLYDISKNFNKQEASCQS